MTAADDFATVREQVGHIARGCRSSFSHEPATHEQTIDAALARVEAADTRLQEGLDDLLNRSETDPLNVDISNYGDEWCDGFLAGQRNALEELAALRGDRR